MWRRVLESLIPMHVLEPLTGNHRRDTDDAGREASLALARARQFQLEEELYRRGLGGDPRRDPRRRSSPAP